MEQKKKEINPMSLTFSAGNINFNELKQKLRSGTINLLINY